MNSHLNNSHLNKVRQWAMFRSTAATAVNRVVPLVLRGQDATNSHTVSGGVVDLLVGRTYIISAGLPPYNSSGNERGIEIQRSIDGGAAWGPIWGSGMSGASAGNSSGTSITDVYTTTVPTKLRLNTITRDLKAGVWLYIEVK